MLRAALLMSVGMTLIPLGDSAGKAMTSAGIAPVFVAWTRFTLGTLMLLPLLGPQHRDLSAFRDWRVLFRGALTVVGITAILTALKTEPLANVFGAFFIGPTVSYVLSVWLLKEKVTATRTVLLLIGFAGVLLIAKPGFGFTPGIGFALLAGCCYGSFLTASRWLAAVAPPRTLMLTQLVVGAVALAPFGLSQIPAITPQITGLVLVSAAASLGGNLLLIMAYKLAPATRLAPLVYVQLIGATLFGALFFGTWPDTLAFAGLGLLMASGFAAFLLKK